MTLRALTLGPLAFAVAALQSAVLGWMVWDRVTLLQHGREIVLTVIPVDPRSLFRGDYVVLTYPVSMVGLEGKGGPEFKYGAPVYVTLGEQADRTWQLVRASTERPESAPAEHVVLRGKIRRSTGWWAGPGYQVPVAYGIESYFVPEGKGRELETLVRDKKISTLVAVNRDGKAAIKGLLVDGVLAYSEPLF